MKPEEMVKVQLLCAKKQLRKVIKELHTMKILHIVDHVKGELDIGSPLEGSARVSETLVKIRGIISYLKIDPETKVNEKEFDRFVNKRGITDIESVSKTAGRLYDEIVSLLAEQKEIESQVASLSKSLEEISILRELNVDPSFFRESQSLASFLGTVNDARSLLSELRALTQDYEVSVAPVEKKTMIALFVRKKKKQEVQQILSRYNFQEFRPAIKEGDLKKMHDEGKDSMARLKARQGKVMQKLDKLTKEWSNFLVINEKRLSSLVEQENAPLRFAETKSTSLITGWVPLKDYDKFFMRMNELTQGKIVINRVDADHDADVPIKLNHVQPVKSFEWFMELYSLPHYKEIDPTIMMFITFPLFFGFMLGDVGYGLVTLAFFLALRKLMPDMRFLLNAMVLCSLSSIAFGLIYGEVFGFEQIGHWHIPHLISRTHEVTTMLIIAVAIGAIHVNVGFIIGFFNELHHGLWRAITEKGSWLIIEAGIILLVLSILSLIPFDWILGAAIILLGIILLILGEGAKGVIELPTLASHALSYARLMAVGLASVVLALVINENSMEFIKGGGVMTAVGILILVIGHTVNIALGVIGPFLHSLRLHYVEFFTKFYKGGGKRYTPFGEEV